MPVQKIVTMREGEEVEPGWWFVKMLGKETRTVEGGASQETLLLVLVARNRESERVTPPV